MTGLHTRMAVWRCAAVCMLALPTRARTQAVPAPSAAAVALAAAQSDSLYLRGDAAGSLARATQGLQRVPEAYPLLWRAARGEIMHGIIEADRAVIEGHYTRAVRYARAAVARMPNDTAGHFWLAAVLGRRALRAGFRGALPLAAESFAEARRVLVIDSLHAGAHDIVGKLHSEVRKLPTMMRLIAGTVTGLDLVRTASWDEAERHLQRAIALDARAILPRADLAQLYQRMGRRAEAERVVRELEAMPRVTPADAYFQGEARKRLQRGP